MKSVYIAGSRKFYDEIELLLKKLKDNGIKVSTAGKWNSNNIDTLKSEKKALLTAFNRIDSSDIVYIYAKDGYIGKTVALEIGYSYAKKKEIISLSKIEEFSAQALIDKVMDENGLVKYCK